MSGGNEPPIGARARAFDATSLLDLLAERFPDRQILVRSQPSLAPAPTLFDGVEVYPDRIVVRVNVGLRSSTTPLPSYFLQLFAEPRVGPGLASLVDELDGGILPARLAAVHIDAGALLPLDPVGARRTLLTLAQPASPSTLHWLFAAVFPEFTVRVARSPLVRILPSDEARLEEAIMGIATLGGEAAVPVTGFDAVLRTRDSATWGDVPWRQEALRRVRAHVLSALAGTGTYLRVILVDTEAKGQLTLGSESGTYLGFDPIERAASPLATLVFDGQVPETPEIGAPRAAS